MDSTVGVLGFWGFGVLGRTVEFSLRENTVLDLPVRSLNPGRDISLKFNESLAGKLF